MHYFRGELCNAVDRQYLNNYNISNWRNERKEVELLPRDNCLYKTNQLSHHRDI